MESVSDQGPVEKKIEKSLSPINSLLLAAGMLTIGGGGGTLLSGANMGSKLEAFEVKLDGLEKNIGVQFENLGEKIEKQGEEHNRRLHALEGKLDAHLHKDAHPTAAARLRELERRIEKLEDKRQ